MRQGTSGVRSRFHPAIQIPAGGETVQSRLGTVGGQIIVTAGLKVEQTPEGLEHAVDRWRREDLAYDTRCPRD